MKITGGFAICAKTTSRSDSEMVVSEKKKSELYSAIHEQVIQLRMKLKREHDLPEYVDHQIAQLVTPIYREVKSTLNIKE